METVPHRKAIIGVGQSVISLLSLVLALLFVVKLFIVDDFSFCSDVVLFDSVFTSF